MLESGSLEGWVVPRVQDKPRLNKPPLIYWLQAGSAAILGDAPGQWAWLDGGSENIWVYRVPSVLSAILAVLLTWQLGTRMFDPRAAWLAAALLAVCPMVVWDAHQARADQLLLAMTTATMLCLWNVWRLSEPSRASGRSSELPRPTVELEEGTQASRHQGIKSSSFRSIPRSIAPSIPLFWLFLSLGILTKGPITPMIAGLTILSLCLISRDWSLVRRLRPLLGVLIITIVVAPWVILVGREVGWSKYLSIVYDETIGRSAGAKEGHWGPPGYHIILLGVLFWPGSLLTAAAIGRACRRGLKRNHQLTKSQCHHVTKSDPPLRGSVVPSLRAFPSAVASSLRAFLASRPGRHAELFGLAWMLPSWIVFELVGTKLPHYTMPLYPAVALTSARMLLASASSRRARPLPASAPSRVDVGSIAWLVIGAMLIVVFPFMLAVGRLLTIDSSPGWIEFALAVAVCLALAILLARTFPILLRKRRLDATITAMLGFTIALVLVFGWLLPRCDLLWGSTRIAQSARQLDPHHAATLCSADYKEDSLIFLTRGSFLRLSGRDHLLSTICSTPSCIVVSAQGDFWKAAMDSIRCDLSSAGEVNIGPAFNYSTGQSIHPWLFQTRLNSR